MAEYREEDQSRTLSLYQEVSLGDHPKGHQKTHYDVNRLESWSLRLSVFDSNQMVNTPLGNKLSIFEVGDKMTLG